MYTDKYTKRWIFQDDFFFLLNLTAIFDVLFLFLMSLIMNSAYDAEYPRTKKNRTFNAIFHKTRL